MAGLLRWSVGMALPKKKDENLTTPLINSLQTMNPIIASSNKFATITQNNGVNNTNNLKPGTLLGNTISRLEQASGQTVQQLIQKQQQEEAQRQQRIAEAKRQQEQRRQEENERKLKQQQEIQQKQRNLLNSAGLGNGFMTATELRSNLEVQKQAKTSQQQSQQNIDDGWKKYYDEEKRKVRDQAFKNDWGGSTLQDIFNSGWDRRLAETNARNRYDREILEKAYDDNGNVKDQNAANLARRLTNVASSVAKQYNEQERANSRAIGATHDSDVKDNQLLATFNAIRRADIGNAMLGGAEGGVADVTKFLINTGQYAIPYAGWAQGILRGAPSVVESTAGYGLDKETGKYRNLTLPERAGRAVSGGIDVVGPKLNASEKLAGGILNLLKGGTKEVAKQTGKAALKEFTKNALGEGIEEGVQEVGDYFGDGNKITDENGNISGEKIGQLAGQVGQAAALGALGGGIMSGANILVGKAANLINANRNSNVDTGVNENADINTDVNEETNISTENIKTNEDGSMVKVNQDGSTTRLSDFELANVIDQETKNTGINPFKDNSTNFRSGSEDINTLTKRALQGDTYAKRKIAELAEQNQAEETDWRGKTVDEVINPKNTEETQEDATKKQQFETIKEKNPMQDDYHTGIRSADDIKNYDEIMRRTSAEHDAEGDFGYPDWTQTDAETMMANGGKITLYSSKPIEEGGFVTPSKMMAEDYAGNGPVYSKEVNVEDVAWISGDEGQYAPRSAQNEINAQAAKAKQEALRYNIENQAPEEVVATKIDTSGAGEGTTEAFTRIPTTEELSVRTPEQQRFDAQTPKGEVKSISEVVNTPSGKNSFVTLLQGVSDRVRNVIKNAIGIDVAGYNHTIDSSSVKHALKRHSNDAIPLRAEDFDLVPDIIKNADNVEYVGKNRKGLDVIRYTKQYDNQIAYLEEVRNGRHQLATDTMYWARKGQQKSGPTGESSAVNATDPLRASSRPVGDTTQSIPQDSINVKNKSQFAENTSGNRNFSNETRTDLKSDPLTYKPTTNEERLTRANEILSTKSTDEIDNYLRENFFNVKPKDADSADMVLAGEYAKMLDAKGQYDRSTEIINRMSEIGTKQGQNIQALSLMMNRSPEGIANMAQSAIKKSGGQITGELRQEIVKRTQEIGRTRGERNKLAQENTKISEQIMSGKGDLKTLRKRQMAIAQEYRQNLDQEGRQFSQLSDIVGKNSPDNRSVFGSIWRAGLLSGPRTHTGNAVSNTFQNIINAGADRFASGLDWARSKITGTERQIVSNAGGRDKGLKRGLKAAGEVLRTGDNLWDSTDMATGKVNAWGQGGEMEFKNKIANTMVAKPTNFIFRAMSAGDLPFRYAAFENAIRTEAKRQGVNLGYKGQALQDYINSRVATPDPELQAYGVRKGNEAVYDVDTKLSDVMTRVDKFIDSQDNKLVKNGLKTAKTLIAPFVKIPSKVLSTAVDYSPLGSVKAIVNKVGSKKYTTGQFETDLAKSGLGTAGFVGLGYALSAAGLLTGGYPDDKDERNRWKVEGIEPNSIKIGDKYISMNYLGPMGMLTAMGAGIQQRQEKGENALSITTGTLMDTLNSFLDQSYVQGLSNAVNAITDSQRYGESYINSLARGITPNLLRQTAVATDPKQRQVNNVGEAIMSGIPGLSQTLDAKVDAYGREIENKQTLPLGQMWDALKINNSRDTNDVIDEVSRLHSVDPNNKELQITPPMEDNTLSVNGTNIKITDAQKTQLQKDTGAAALKTMRQVISSSSYNKLSDTEKAEALDKACKDAQKQARQQFIKANNITADNNPETRNSGGQVNGDFSSKAISSAKSSGANKKGISINESLAQEHKDILDNYNAMSSEDWEKYVYGTNKGSASAEYKLALAKYENDVANGDLTDAQRIKREKELRKLAVSQEWTKDYRDAYSLAGSKADMQDLLNQLDDETRVKTIGILNGLNNAMYEAGVIAASTYKTRANAINNTSSKKSSGNKSKYGGITSAEASALSSLAKSMIKGGEGSKIKTTSAPNTKRRMSKSKTSNSQSKLTNYSTNLATNVTVNKGAKKSIG